MKNALNLILTALLAWALTMFTPWWGILIAAMVVSFLFPLKGGYGFIIPFAAIFLLWGSQAYLMSSSNDFIMAGKVADLFSLNGNAILLILITALIGGLSAGFAALLGKQLKLIAE